MNDKHFISRHQPKILKLQGFCFEHSACGGAYRIHIPTGVGNQWKKMGMVRVLRRESLEKWGADEDDYRYCPNINSNYEDCEQMMWVHVRR